MQFAIFIRVHDLFKMKLLGKGEVFTFHQSCQLTKMIEACSANCKFYML